MSLKHSAWKIFGESIQKHSIDDVHKNKEFLATMYCNSYVEEQLRYLQNFYSNKKIEEIVWEPVSNLSEGNNIHQFYHLVQFLQSAQPKNLDCITEFGAGYGSLCVRFSRLLGFKRYNIIDIPELQGLQREYIERNNVENVFWYSSFDDYLQDVYWDEVSFGVDSRDLLIGMWSISETPKEIRNSIMNKAAFNSYMFAFGNSFYDLQNGEFFKKFRDIRTDLFWKTYPCPFKQDQYYMFGEK